MLEQFFDQVAVLHAGVAFRHPQAEAHLCAALLQTRSRSPNRAGCCRFPDADRFPFVALRPSSPFQGRWLTIGGWVMLQGWVATRQLDNANNRVYLFAKITLG